MITRQTISILGCGWLGLPLAEAFVQAGFNVKGSTTRRERMSLIEASGVVAYLLKAEDGNWHGEQLADFLQCDILVIAIPPGSRRNANSTHARNVGQLMEHIKQHALPIKQIVYISSTSVYKNTNQIVIESDTEQQLNIENYIVFQAEEHVRKNTATDFLILRLGGLTGYDRMLGRFFAGKQELAGGNEPVNLVHRDDVVAAILHLLNKKISNTILNICSPLHPSRYVFYTQVCERFKLPAPHFSAITADWKEISCEKINQTGYVWLFPDPFDYTYTWQQS